MAELEKFFNNAALPENERVAAAESLLARYEWFTAARVVRAFAKGETDALTALLKSGRGVSSLGRKSVDSQLLAQESEGEIIDRFLELDNYRIVADEGADEDDVQTEAEFDDDDDLVTEELAEVFASQGLKNEAVEIYRKLSLRNTEKSVYFAEKIRNLTE